LARAKLGRQRVVLTDDDGKCPGRLHLRIGHHGQSRTASQIDYYYVSRLPGEPAEGVADRHFHPVEPLALGLTLAKAF